MILSLQRYRHDKYGTFGQLFLQNGDFLSPLCFTLEPSRESRDIFGKDCIEDGEYQISVTYSQRFKKNLPLVHHPNRSGIRFHAGNTVQDTSGCILVGLFDEGKLISSSRVSLSYLLSIIQRFNITKLKIDSFYGKVPCF